MTGVQLVEGAMADVELSLRSITDAVQLDHRRIERLGFAGAIRGALLGAPPQESPEYLDGWYAALGTLPPSRTTRPASARHVSPAS